MKATTNPTTKKAATVQPPASAAAAEIYLQIPLDRIAESRTNPRKQFRGLEELAGSMTAHGVLEPLLVRANGSPDSYELVSGARRLRAAKLAGLAAVPAIVRELSDKDVLEIQVIENDQREDPAPLEQARGYAALLEAGYDVASLAAKIGRSESYVTTRLQLNRLSKAWQKHLEADRIGFGHALLIARLTEADQADFLGLCRYSLEGGGIGNVQRLRSDIASRYHLDLHAAAFAKDCANLVKGCGPCTICPKRTGHNAALFPDIEKKDTCTDRQCFAAKQTAWVERQRRDLEAKGQEFVQISTSYGYYGRGKKPEGVLFADGYENVSRKEAKTIPAEELRTALVVEGGRVAIRMWEAA